MKRAAPAGKIFADICQLPRRDTIRPIEGSAHLHSDYQLGNENNEENPFLVVMDPRIIRTDGMYTASLIAVNKEHFILVMPRTVQSRKMRDSSVKMY